MYVPAIARNVYVCMYSWLICTGTAVSGAIVSELWSAISEMKNYRNREVVEYSKAVESFLQSWLPLSGTNFDESEEIVVAGGSKTTEWSFSRASSTTGESKNSLRISASTHYNPLVQGPIARAGSILHTGSVMWEMIRFSIIVIMVVLSYQQELRQMLSLPAGLWIFASRRAMLSLLRRAAVMYLRKKELLSCSCPTQTAP